MKRLNNEILNIVLISTLAVVESVQLLLVLSFVASLIPLSRSLESQLLPEFIKQLKPEYDTMLYRFFVIFTIGLQAGLFFVFRSKIKEEGVVQKVFPFLVAETVVLAFLAFSWVKEILYPDLVLWEQLLYVAMGLTVVVKLGWLWGRSFLLKSVIFLENRKISILDWLAPLLIFLIIYIPNREEALAGIYQLDRFYHWDSFIVGPAWAAFKGALLNWDVMSQYGIGMPMVVGWLAKIIGGFQLNHILLIFIVSTIIYFWLWYIFLRQWLKASWLGLVGALWAMKWQMFYYESTLNFIWLIPSGSAVRSLPDVFFFLCLLFYVRSRKEIFLFLGALMVGLAMVYVTDTGVQLFVTLVSALLLIGIIPEYRDPLFARRNGRLFYGTLFLIPGVVALIILWFIYGPRIMDMNFWNNSSEYIRMTQKGFDALPMEWGIVGHAYFAVFTGFFVAFSYIFVLNLVGSLVVWRKISADHLVVIALCIYGLCRFHYFVFRSAAVSHYSVSTPFVIMVCWVIKQGVQLLPADFKRPAVWGIVGLTCFAVFTSHVFIRYPNVFNLSGADYKEQKEAAAQLSSIEKDVQLIQSLTSPQEKVCLISSSEVNFLMRSDRRPFFYYFPLISSSPLIGEGRGSLKLFSKEQVAKTLGQIQEEAPSYIFIEQKLLTEESPSMNQKQHAVFLLLLKYIRQFYAPVDQGEYLVAFKRHG